MNSSNNRNNNKTDHQSYISDDIFLMAKGLRSLTLMTVTYWLRCCFCEIHYFCLHQASCLTISLTPCIWSQVFGAEGPSSNVCMIVYDDSSPMFAWQITWRKAYTCIFHLTATNVSFFISSLVAVFVNPLTVCVH